MGTLDDLPAVLDIRDDLRAALDESEAEIDDEVSGIYDRLEDFTERDRASQESLLDDVDDELLELQERCSGDAARRIEAARNRIRAYRDSLDGASENLAVLETTFRAVESETEATLSDLADERGVVSATVINESDPREIMLAATFYDADDETVDEVVGDDIRLDADEQRQVDVEARVPDSADYYTVTVLDAGERSEAIGE
ncbi:hypothetical protein ACFQDG_02475 [Natronoarchaeum mannanilyticum]|uniref:Uncharacterized protein n=1 Tax=Natronoarchaeum mannanilyticum TaxID=926360 RepID=A0AAV3T9E7_9EURY